MASKAKKADAPKAAAASPAGVKAPAKPRGRVVKGRPSRGSAKAGVQVGATRVPVTALAAGHHAADPIADDFVDIHRIAAKQPHLGLPALASALEAAFRRMAARLGKK